MPRLNLIAVQFIKITHGVMRRRTAPNQLLYKRGHRFFQTFGFKNKEVNWFLTSPAINFYLTSGLSEGVIKGRLFGSLSLYFTAGDYVKPP
jgi:hypothetical protein